MEDAKTQLIQRLKAANNILVTVSTNPNVDQLAACIGITLWLNKVGKHATAVFSGDIPNALEFLQPEATIEKTTDSLRDFIIALDKSKADKLRYKVEDRVVKIFITPYHTSLSADDLEFSQGDFNVDAIVALGVSKQEDLDNAIMSHGRILHDAVVSTINITGESGLGSINWTDQSASSLSELAYELCLGIDETKIDPQIATALLTGVVAETNRFSNNKTTPHTMSISSALMSAGANQQLVANKLEAANKSETADGDKAKQEEQPAENQASPDGTLEIAHEETEAANDEPKDDELKTESGTRYEDYSLASQEPPEVDLQSGSQESIEGSKIITEPPRNNVPFSASSVPGNLEETHDGSWDLPPVDSSQLENKMGSTQVPETRSPHLQTQPQPEQPPAQIQIPGEQPPAGPAKEEVKPMFEDREGQTLIDIENAVASPHLNALRDQVNDALKAGPLPDPEPQQSLNAINVDLGPQPPSADNLTTFNPDNFEVKEHVTPEEHEDPNAPPQVPPPIVPPDFLPPSPPLR